jgi:hypothetical protein
MGPIARLTAKSLVTAQISLSGSNYLGTRQINFTSDQGQSPNPLHEALCLDTGSFVLGRYGKAAPKSRPLILCDSFASKQFWKHHIGSILKKYKKQPQVARRSHNHVKINASRFVSATSQAQLGSVLPSLFPLVSIDNHALERQRQAASAEGNGQTTE